jgi:hypothetical protein
MISETRLWIPAAPMSHRIRRVQGELHSDIGSSPILNESMVISSLIGNSHHRTSKFHSLSSHWLITSLVKAFADLLLRIRLQKQMDFSFSFKNPQASQDMDVDSVIHRPAGRCLVSSHFESDSPILSHSNLAVTPLHLLLSYTSALALESRVNDFSWSTRLREPVDEEWLVHLNQDGYCEETPNRDEHQNTFLSCVRQLAEFNQ